MPFAIKPIYPGMRVCGPALTVDCKPGDNLAIHAAVEQAEPGDVLVVDYKGFSRPGRSATCSPRRAVAAGIVGLVIDGCVRDGPTLREMRFPVFARGLNMKGTAKNAAGAVGVPIVCAGVRGVARRRGGRRRRRRGRGAARQNGGGGKAARERDDKEADMRERLKAGATTVDLLGLSDRLRNGGAP